MEGGAGATGGEIAIADPDSRLPLPDFFDPAKHFSPHGIAFPGASGRMRPLGFKYLQGKSTGVFQHDMTHILEADVFMSKGKSAGGKPLLQFPPALGRRPDGIRLGGKQKDRTVCPFQRDGGGILPLRIDPPQQILPASPGRISCGSGLRSLFRKIPDLKRRIRKFLISIGPAGRARWIISNQSLARWGLSGSCR